MPIKITDQNNEEIAWLCDDVWGLPAQIEALDNWLINDSSKLNKGKYSADIGFSSRAGAAGGGCKLSTESMQALLSLGMELFFSEYPEFGDEKP